MRTNMVGTNWAWVTRWRSIRARAVGGVEVLHEDDGGAQSEHGHGVDEGGRVVERGRREIDRTGSDARLGQSHGDLDGCGRGVAQGRGRQGLADPFGLTGGTRRVEHLPALDFVVDGRGIEGRRGRLVVVEAGQ